MRRDKTIRLTMSNREISACLIDYFKIKKVLPDGEFGGSLTPKQDSSYNYTFVFDAVASKEGSNVDALRDEEQKVVQVERPDRSGSPEQDPISQLQV